MGKRNAGTFTVELESHIGEDMLASIFVKKMAERKFKLDSQYEFDQQCERLRERYLYPRRKKKEIWELWCSSSSECDPVPDWEEEEQAIYIS